jgi:AhpD family alkylhydroperoxidase
MERIVPVDPQTAQGKAKELLDAVKAKLGLVPNMTRAMAVSPAVLEAYLGISGALAHGVLPPRVREQLALHVGQANGCGYCLSAHSTIGKRVGLTDQAILDSCQGHSADPKTDACSGSPGRWWRSAGWSRTPMSPPSGRPVAGTPRSPRSWRRWG